MNFGVFNIVGEAKHFDKFSVTLAYVMILH